MTTTWSFENRHMTRDEFLLQEIGDFLLQEDGGKIVLDESQDWTFETKN
jgi:hypothetical protein